MKNILILEDNRNALVALQKAIEDLDDKIKVYAAASISEACRILYDCRIHLFILDIVLKTEEPGNTSGIRFAEMVRTIEQYKFTPIIFTTALADPEMYAYRTLHSFAYLEKPFDMKEATELIAKALEFPVSEKKLKMEFFRKDGILVAVNLEKVVYAEVCRRRMRIHMVGETVEIPYLSVKRFLQQSQMGEFIQCNRYTVVNISYVRSVDLTRGYLELQGGIWIEIGGVFAKRLKIFK